ncbi:MAG: phosphomannose isomerase type II C-terminal cupin domain [Acidimicrobiales bacterium]
MVRPGKRRSYQRHALRSEHWFIVRGTAQAILDGMQRELMSGDSLDIPAGTDHRVGTIGHIDLVFVEVQHGAFGEDDTVRVEDDFGRNEG